jgi:hypothetical protein
MSQKEDWGICTPLVITSPHYSDYSVNYSVSRSKTNETANQISEKLCEVHRKIFTSPHMSQIRILNPRIRV